MTDATASAGSEQEPAEAGGPVVRDRRRIDPQTGQVRRTEADRGETTMTQEKPGSDSGFAGAVGDDLPGGVQPEPGSQTAAQAQASAEQEQPATSGEGAQEQTAGAPAQATAEERAAELQDQLLREKADFHNYRELMKRERPKDREQAIGSVVEALLPVMDDIHLAREHGDLAGTPFEKIAEKLEATLGRFGVQAIGAAGDAFDPALHEALMHVEAELPEGSEGTTVVQVMQPGYKVGERVVRPARVSVADPA